MPLNEFGHPQLLFHIFSCKFMKPGHACVAGNNVPAWLLSRPRRACMQRVPRSTGSGMCKAKFVRSVQSSILVQHLLTRGLAPAPCKWRVHSAEAGGSPEKLGARG